MAVDAPAPTVDPFLLHDLEDLRSDLLERLTSRLPDIQRRRRYYDGTHPQPTAPNQTTELYRRIASLARTNVCGLVVDAVMERLAIDGVRTDSAADLGLWRDVWAANALDAEAEVAHAEALKVGRSFVLVWPTPDGVSVTVEDPAELLVAYEPGNRRRATAAIKAFRDGDTLDVTLWTASYVARWGQTAGRWALASIDTNPLGVVPVVELMCRPHFGQPKAILTDSLLTIQDRINKTTFDLLVLSEFQAFRQRYAIGIEVETFTDPDTGAVKAKNPLTVGPDRTWLLQADDPSKAQIGQLDAADLGPHREQIEADIKLAAAISKTPVYYLLSGMINVSADAIRAAETGHVAAVRSHQRSFGEAWEAVFGLAARALGQPAGADLEVMWASPESHSLAELADASLKLQQAGYPFEAIARRLGESQEEIARLQAQRPQPVEPTPTPGA